MNKRTKRDRTDQNREQPLHGSRIEDYALIGDCETAALVSRTGSIDWLCWPTFSSAACFAALLGTAEHGYWRIAPTTEPIRVRRQYLPQTLVVETIFETATGSVAILDFMPPREKFSRVLRQVRCLRGKVDLRMELAIRFDYGRTIPWVTHHDQSLRAVAGPDMVVLHTDLPLKGEGFKTISQFTLRAGKCAWFSLASASSLGEVPAAPNYDDQLRDTVGFWTEWAGRSTYRGLYQEIVDRSLITLKALTYRPAGGIVAAPTASLPEEIGGKRNWDYRYCWLRDTSFTLLVLLHMGYEEEAIAWRRWLLRAIAGTPGNVQTVYGICGERQLNEWTADWLPGYENSKPVNIGNGASGQFQLDVFGEVATALIHTPPAENDIRVDASSVQAEFIDHLCQVWQEPDEGIWEVRGPRQHFVYSKVMAWVALDRAIKHHEIYDGGGDIKRWRKNRDMIHKEVLEKGFDRKRNTFVQAYGSSSLDASCLRLPMVGFLPPDDPRIIGTIDAIQKGLTKDGLVQRYDTETTDDGLSGKEGAFLACSFWLATDLYLIGRKQEAKQFFDELVGLCNDVGLISEEYDSSAKRMVGNFPQALSHIALVHTALTLSDRWRPVQSTNTAS